MTSHTKITKSKSNNRKNENQNCSPQLNEIYEKLYQAGEQDDNDLNTMDDIISPWQQNKTQHDKDEILVQNNKIIRQVRKPPKLQQKHTKLSDYISKRMSESNISPSSTSQNFLLSEPPLTVLTNLRQDHQIKPSTAPFTKKLKTMIQKKDPQINKQMRRQTTDNTTSMYLVSKQKQYQYYFPMENNPDYFTDHDCSQSLQKDLTCYLSQAKRENMLQMCTSHKNQRLEIINQHDQSDYKANFVPYSENNIWGKNIYVSKQNKIQSQQTIVMQQIKKALEVCQKFKRQDSIHIEQENQNQQVTHFLRDEYQPFKHCKNKINNINMIRHNIQIKIRQQQKNNQSSFEKREQCVLKSFQFGNYLNKGK